MSNPSPELSEVLALYPYPTPPGAAHDPGSSFAAELTAVQLPGAERNRGTVSVLLSKPWRPKPPETP